MPKTNENDSNNSSYMGQCNCSACTRQYAAPVADSLVPKQQYPSRIQQAFQASQAPYAQQTVYQQQYQPSRFAQYEPQQYQQQQAPLRAPVRQVGGYSPLVQATPASTAAAAALTTAQAHQNYADQMAATYYNYQQQQQAQQAQQQALQEEHEQYQQQLLKQLYQQQPQLGQFSSGIPQTQYQSSYQGQSGQAAGNGQQYYTAQQYAELLQKQQQQVQSDQFHNIQSTYASRDYTNFNSPPVSSTAAPPTGYANGLYSPADKVSHVRFSNNNQSYKF